MEVCVAGNAALARGWQTFARARGLGRRCTLHFKYDGDVTLYVRVFGQDGRRAGCCPEVNDGEEVLGRDEDEGEPALGTGRASSSYGGSSLGASSTAVASTSRHATALASKVVASRLIAAPP